MAAAAAAAAAAATATARVAPHATAALRQVLQRHGREGAPEGLWDGLMALFSAVEWSREYWLLGVFAFHALVLVVGRLSRRQWHMQLFLILSALVSVYGAERLNALGHTHWRAFAGQNYFDRSGVFVSLIWSLPLILNSLLILCTGLYDVARLVVALKRRDVQRQQRAKRNAANTVTASAQPNAAAVGRTKSA